MMVRRRRLRRPRSNRRDAEHFPDGAFSEACSWYPRYQGMRRCFTAHRRANWTPPRPGGRGEKASLRRKPQQQQWRDNGLLMVRCLGQYRPRGVSMAHLA